MALSGIMMMTSTFFDFARRSQPLEKKFWLVSGSVTATTLHKVSLAATGQPVGEFSWQSTLPASLCERDQHISSFPCFVSPVPASLHAWWYYSGFILLFRLCDLDRNTSYTLLRSEQSSPYCLFTTEQSFHLKIESSSFQPLTSIIRRSSC